MKRERNVWWLGLLALLAVGYAVGMNLGWIPGVNPTPGMVARTPPAVDRPLPDAERIGYTPSLLGSHKADGIAGVLLGLFISSQPAANLFDMLFFLRTSGWQGMTRGRLVSWLSLNLAVLALGAFTVVLATTQLVIVG